MLSDDEKLHYETEFNKFDVSRKGMICDRDFTNKIKESDDALTHKEVKKLIKELDYDNTSQISYSDFLIATLDIKKLLTKERLETIFNKFADQVTKTISEKDIETMLTSNSFDVSEKE